MRELSDVLADHSISLADILLKIQVAAARAGNEEMANWAAKEGSGYSEKDELPTYRVWGMSIEATLHAGLHVSRVQVPHAWLPDEQREAVTTFMCRTGMKGIERTLNEAEGNNGTLEVPHPNLTLLVQNCAPLSEGVVCIAATAKFPIGHFADVATRARQVALTWSLKCEEKGEGMIWPEDKLEEEAERRKWKERVKEKGTLEAVRVISKAAWEFAKQQWMM